VDGSSNTQINTQTNTYPYNSGFNEVNNLVSDIIYTPNTNQTVKFRVTGGTTGITAQQRGAGFSRAVIQQIANTFALTAIDGLTTTGNVSIGGTASVNGNLGVTGSASIVGNLTVSGTSTIGVTQVYAWPTNGATSGYVRLGTWTTTSNAGQMLDIKMTLHNGYNADPTQIQVIESVFMLSNNSTLAATGNGTVVTGSVLGTGVATKFSKLGGGTALTGLVLVQNSSTSYTIWAQGVVPYTDNSMYQVVHGSGSTWSNSGTFQSGAPSYGSNYVVITPQTT
jgi:hypothetical protein